MKKITTTIVACCTIFSTTSFSQNDYNDSLGLPGDGLDLYGVMELFKTADNLENFEKAINNPDNKVNNLDLDDDGQVDYIKVVDHVNNDVHAITLQVPVTETESQDMAVIELEKKGENIAEMQIVGDEDMYGKEYIIEANKDEGAVYDEEFFSANFGVYVNVWGWPCVKYMYGPKYVVWVSPWKYKYYPVWWKPWPRVWWNVHRKRVIHYHAWGYRVNTHRMVVAHGHYHKHRVTSVTVHKKHVVHHNNKPNNKTNGKSGNVQKQKNKPTNNVNKKSGGGGNKGGKRK
jgi:hypothetical protein